MRRIAVALLALLVVGGTTGGASAAQLRLTGAPSFSAARAARCDTAVAVTTPVTPGAATSVAVSGILAACAGRTIEVRMWDAASSSVAFTASGTVPAGGGALTLTGTPAFTPTAALAANVMIASWPVPATWSYTAPALACTVTGVVRWANNSAGAWTRYVDAPTGQTCSAALASAPTVPNVYNPYSDLTVTVTTASAGSVQWSVAMNFAAAVFPFVPTGLTSWANFHTTSACAARPTVRLQGDLPYHDTVTADQPRALAMRAYQSAGGTVLSCA